MAVGGAGLGATRAHASTNVQYLGAGGLHDAYVATGGTGQIPTRDAMDSLRLGQARTPNAEWPDGYLGTIRTRWDDRLVESVQQRENTHPYSRGVHKGERIGVQAYFWPSEFQPQRGVENQLRGGPRQTPIGIAVLPVPLTNDGKADIESRQPAQFDPVRSHLLTRLKPSWQ